jgi:hypothetical protein
MTRCLTPDRPDGGYPGRHDTSTNYEVSDTSTGVSDTRSARPGDAPTGTTPRPITRSLTPRPGHLDPRSITRSLTPRPAPRPGTPRPGRGAPGLERGHRGWTTRPRRPTTCRASCAEQEPIASDGTPAGPSVRGRKERARGPARPHRDGHPPRGGTSRTPSRGVRAFVQAHRSTFTRPPDRSAGVSSDALRFRDASPRAALAYPPDEGTRFSTQCAVHDGPTLGAKPPGACIRSTALQGFVREMN